MHGVIDELLPRDITVAPSAPRAAGERRVVYFCPDVTDASTLKRAQQFIDHGYGVTVFAFRRKRYNMGYEPDWPYVPLGMTSDGRYWHRLQALLGAIPAILSRRTLVKRATAIYARNIDQLLLAILARLFAFSRAPVTYEVLDIPPILMGRGPVAAALRWIERLCLKHVHLLVLSSPGFHRGYFAAVQNYRGAWFLLENKLHPSIAGHARPPARVRPGENRRPWVIGYFGLIRGEATFNLMTRLAQRLGDRVQFKFRGVLTTVDPGHFEQVLRRCPNMVYGGPYLPHDDLAQLYGDVDFAWALDLENTDHNSRWLLPCRFYEAGYFSVPCLAVHGFEVGSMLERHRIGFTFDEPLEEELVRFFMRLSSADYDHVRGRLEAVPSSMFLAGDDIARLCSALEGAVPTPAAG